MDNNIKHITVQTARRYLLMKQGLFSDHRFKGKQGAYEYISQASCLQFDPVDVMLELGDILYYFTAICNILGVDLSEIMLNNNAKLMERYKDGYSIKQSLNRIEENGDNR